MLDVHRIEWIVLETASGGIQKKEWKPGDVPETNYSVIEPIVAAYEFFNPHGLWMDEGVRTNEFIGESV